MRRYFAFIALLLTVETAAGVETGYEATYALHVGPLTVGKMERTFVLARNGGYKFTSTVSAKGLVSLFRGDELLETSSGSYEAGRYFPDRYTYERNTKRKPRSIVSEFDRANQTVDTVYNGEHRTTPLKDDALDNLIYQAALMDDLAAGRSKLSYSVIDRGREKVYEAVIGDKSVVETKLGDFETVAVVRGSPDDKKRTVFWCAPALDYLPVRVSLRDKKGKETLITIVGYQRKESPPTLGP